jgi:hypothetical protein
MTLRPYFEVVEAEMQTVTLDQSDQISALGFDGGSILVQFHHIAGLYAAPATRAEYEALLAAPSIMAVFSARIAEILPAHVQHDPRWFHLAPLSRERKRTT